jgi:hypothetical protein
MARASLFGANLLLPLGYTTSQSQAELFLYSVFYISLLVHLQAEVVLLFLHDLAVDLSSPELALDNIMVEGNTFCTKVFMLKWNLPMRAGYCSL